METSKPDLLAASPRTVEDKRILAQLEHGPRAPAIAVRAAGWTVDGWTIGLFALLLFMCGMAWLMHDKRITPETFRQSVASGVVRSKAQPPRAIQAEGLGPAVEQAATIVNEPAPTADKPATFSAEVNSGDRVTVAVAPTASRDVAARTVRSVLATEPARSAVSAASPQSRPQQPGTTPARRTSVPPPAQSSDTDVTLLTALVAHAGKPTSVAPERSRDIVEQREGDSTTLLLARCKQLGMIEGMLCRSRICSGQWETDDACRAPAR